LLLYLLSTLPTGLGYAGDLARQSELAETNPAQRKFTQESARTPAPLATVPEAAAKLNSRSGLFGGLNFGQLLFFFGDLRSSCHK
jgi:hypothetical protein